MNIKLTGNQRAFIAELDGECNLGREKATAVGRELIVMATQHRKLCEIDLAKGLDPWQKAAQDALEERLGEIASDLPGITGTRIMGDPRGTTMGLAMASGRSDSLTGTFKIPTDSKLFVELGTARFWESLTPDPAATTQQ